MPAMFADTKAFGAFAVDDLAQATKFYGETLGVRVSVQHPLLTLHLAGGRDTQVYQKPDHIPATYTILMFQVDDIEAAVGELATRGVEFEHITTGRSVMVSGGCRTPTGTPRWASAWE
jgi:catechol 2,3-dioxygenase-like lactoylglutathione lyase family enzyme